MMICSHNGGVEPKIGSDWANGMRSSIFFGEEL
jgi:hypothetical protein